MHERMSETIYDGHFYTLKPLNELRVFSVGFSPPKKQHKSFGFVTKASYDITMSKSVHQINETFINTISNETMSGMVT